MQEYLSLLRKVLTQGDRREDRTGTGTLSLFGEQIKFTDVYLRFPLLTTKALHTKSIVHELLWMLSGSTNIKYLTDNGVTIWNEWADENGELGPVYGKQWRSWQGMYDTTDQISQVIKDIKNNPYSRRHIVSAWNVNDIGEMRLPPCHLLFQFYVSNKIHDKLHLHLYMRSCDIFLGLPFNIASYALLLSMVASVCHLMPGSLTISFGDVHLYLNHVAQAKEQLKRIPRTPCVVDFTKEGTCKPPESIFDFRYEDIQFLDYMPYPAIKADVSV